MGAPRLIIQHHPSRPELLARLLASVPGAAYEVVTDPDPEGVESAWRTYRECLQRRPGETTVIVQDDAVGCRGAVAALPLVEADHPGQLVALTVCGAPPRSAARVRRADAQRDRYATLHRDDWVPTVAVMWPADARADCLEWADRRFRQDALGDDSIIGKWREHHWREVYATVPSLFQHPDDNPSLIKRRHRDGANRFRVAVVFDPDWTPR